MLQKCNIFKVLDVFFTEPTRSHYLSEICKKTNLPPTSIKNYLNDLIKLKLVLKTTEKKGKRLFPLYKANLSNPSFKKYKKFFNLIKLEESGIIKKLSDKLMPKNIIVFGSYPRGEDVEDSDIDLFLECNKEEVNIDVFSKRLNRRVRLLFNNDFNKYSKELKNNIINGIILKGYLEVF